MRRAVAFAILGIVLPPSISRASTRECSLSAPESSFAAVYAQAVTLFRKGQFSAAARRLDPFGEQRFAEAPDFLRRSGWPEPCLLAAALFHTELGMRAARELDDDRARAEFDRAFELTELVPRERARADFQRNWYLAISLFHQKLMFDPEVLSRAPTEVLSLASILFGNAEARFDDAVEAFPEDPEILLAAGTLFEWSGTPRFGEPRHLGKAETLYERSCRANPNDPEAQLRYGRVLFKRGRFDEAEAPLRRAMELPSDAETTFRAHMALGRLAEREQEYTEAISHYRAATAWKPDWQIGYVALGHGLHVAGFRAESRRALERALHLPWTDDNLFGWWSYETGLTDRFGPILEALRQEVAF